MRYSTVTRNMGHRLSYNLNTGCMRIRKPDSAKHVRVLDPSAPDLRNLEWGELEDNPEGGEFAGETWRAASDRPSRAK